MKPFIKERMLSALDIYMSEIGHYPLLDARNEVKLARQYERGQAAQRQLESGVPGAQQRAELQLAVKRGQQARQRLIQCNLRFVIHLVRQYVGLGLSLGDLVQEGNIGLMTAVERFDHRKGVRFATYAGWWIRQAVLRALAHQGQTIRLPPAVRDELIHLQKVNAQLEARLRRLPTLDELADEMGISRQRVRQLQNWDRQVVSLDVPIGEKSDMALSDVIPDRTASSLEEVLVRRQLGERLHDAIRTHLNSRDQMLLCLRFGLGGAQRKTLQEVAGALGITKERARQVEKTALKRLRRAGVLYELGQI